MYTLFKLFRHQWLYSKIPYPKRLNCTQVDTRPGTISRDVFGFWWHEWSAPADRQVISTTLAVPQSELWPQFCVWKCQQITRTKAYWQCVSLYYTTYIIEPTCVGIYQRLIFYSEAHQKNIQYHPRRLLCSDQTIMATISQSIWWDSSFNMECRPLPAVHDFAHDGISLYELFVTAT